MTAPWTEETKAVAGALGKRIGDATVTGPQQAGLSSSLPDTTCRRIAHMNTTTCVLRGIVIRSGMGTYDCEVNVGRDMPIVCGTLAPTLNAMYGASQSCIPTVGSCVLVYVDRAANGQLAGTGYILGVIGDNIANPLSYSETPVTTFADRESPEGGTSILTEPAHRTIATDDSYEYHRNYLCGRAYDIVPGEYAVLNHAGSGLVIGAVSTQVKGSEFAYLRCSGIDNHVRLVAGQYQRITGTGYHEAYNDGGLLTEETAISQYHPERMGVSAWKTPPFEEQKTDPSESNEKRSRFTQERGQTAIARIRSFAGYLGDLLNVFFSTRVDRDGKNKLSSRQQEQGLCHVHVDSTGRASVRSAGGIILERYDRIPVPKRRCQSWDPEGFDASSHTPTRKDDFRPDYEYPSAIGLTLSDMAAWWNHLSYFRVREFKDDFTVETQQELQDPARRYDDLGNAYSDPLQEYSKRHSYLSLPQDGSIVLHDAWGSEIIMQGGDITFSAARDIYVRSGKSTVVLAGKDAVTRAKGSVDLSATDHDVRIKATNNLQISSDGGVLVESLAKLAGPWSGSGESADSSGVVIRAQSSSVDMVGQVAHIGGSSAINIDAMHDGTPSGIVTISSDRIYGVSKDVITLSAGGGKSGLFIMDGHVSTCAKIVSNIAGARLLNMQGSTFLQGMPVEIESIYADVERLHKTMFDLFGRDTDWLRGRDEPGLRAATFSFRTSEEYGTKTGYGRYGKDKLRICQPSWTLHAQRGLDWMATLSPSKWKERPDASGEYPWPGAEIMLDGKTYITYNERNLSNDVELSDPTGDHAELTLSPLSGYHILHQV